MKFYQILILLLISGPSLAINIPLEYLNPVRVADGQIPDFDNLGFTQDIEAGGQWVHDYTVTSGDTSGWFAFEAQTTTADNLELWAVDQLRQYTRRNPNYLELLAIGDSSFDPTTGLYTHTLEGFLDEEPNANAFAVRLQSEEAFSLTYLAPDVCCFNADGPWLLRPEGAETLNNQRSAFVSEPATAALLSLALIGGLSVRRKLSKV